MKTKEEQNKSILNPDFWYKLNAKKGNIVASFEVAKKKGKPFESENNKKINSLLLEIEHTLIH